MSPLIRDARVLRQLTVLAQHGDVTSLGYGPAPEGATRHLRVDDEAPSLPRSLNGVLGLALRRHERVELAAGGLRQARALVGSERFDLVVANDARALPLAFAVAQGAPVWADMHEWAAEEFSHVLTWRTLVGPLMDDLCRRYLPRSAAVTTVCEPLAGRYTEVYGVPCQVVRNAGPFRDLTPSPVDDNEIRLVHSGAAIRGRNLEMLIRSTLALPAFSLDLYLVPAADGGRYLRELHDLAQGSDRVRFHDPVAPDELPATLNAYDVGVFSMPPININAEFALPNKFFDFVQARLAQAVGPSPEMARLVRELDLGVVADGFGEDAFTKALHRLDPGRVRAGKQAAHAHARALSDERDRGVMSDIVERLLQRTSRRDG
jgi:glycosyltransferase involved in cell wall biosynthesis